MVDGEITTPVWTGDLQAGRFSQKKVDLSRWSGRSIRLRARSSPRDSADFDYVLLGEPVVSSRKADPRTVLLVFVDTLRPDHLGFYGYERDTSRAIDAFATKSVVFEAARSVAPWTLPSARTVLTGRQPEEYDVATSLQATLRAQGWATGMIAGNVYLSPNFGMNTDWDYQHVTNWPDAAEVSAQARQWLAEHDGQDRLLLVHFMDPHLPYDEPEAYRRTFAGKAPPGFDEVVELSDIKSAAPLDADAQAWVIGRYDNNVQHAVDEAALVIGDVDDDDVVVFFADHGEEFWEHRGFEHGHTLFDEVLRVPLVIRAPGIEGRRVAAPVSLLDITPTVLDLVGARAPDLDGVSLVPAMRGEPDAERVLAARDQAFGRPLYGAPRWGVLHEGEKWTTTEGREALYRLGPDPGELENLLKKDQTAAGPGWSDRLGATLGREVAMGYRIAPGRAPGALADDDFVVRVAVPGGIAAAWAGDDPLQGSQVLVEVGPLDTTVDPPVQKAVFTWVRDYPGTREVYLVPTRPVEEVTGALAFDVEYGEDRASLSVTAASGTSPGATRLPLISARLRGSRTFSVGWGWAPQPNAETASLEGSDEELKSALESMGYVEGR
ncbi:MAG: sulfatase-like hydrolase/transferase [Deltaproteobacteria bacterium]|nr:sulfatase-like hydrolase/transferase [Deltaproteobacteria bacterium]